ncbi:DUF4880 domain-containing protein [Bordetella genomosp. 7]|uniref:Iron dicitrate transport regulator FecR n=1 Tax=Bordetella genomosp. 7 TaxID=1416805 RepID=A0A261RKS1_9BORD|nr:DUF4880 domain-containing protein [Bordetella genomosp. 7]OZI24893.1 hypothetical protein CAL19_05240 [Bordetella genomosp. 7]
MPAWTSDAASPDPVAREAIAWWVRLQSGQGGAATEQACRRWRAADPRHEQAWSRLQRLSGMLREVPSDLAHAHFIPPPRSRRTVLKGLAGLLVATGTGAAAYEWTPWQRLISDYSTRVGERRRVMLPGEIRLDLASDSAVSVQMLGQRRQLALLRGQMGVRVPGSDGLPSLTVPASDGARVVAEHAHFGMQRARAGVRIDVYAGSLQLIDADGAIRTLRAGTALYQQRGAWRDAPPEAGQGAWADGMLVANGDRLDSVLAHLARYRHGSLSASPDVADLAVSGVFPLDDTDRALTMLQQSLPISVVRWGAWRVRVEPAHSGGRRPA